MDPQWNDSLPIYRQLRDRVVAMILEGVLKEGDPLPSVRSVAADFRVNPLTVLKGYQQLVDEQLVEKRRGLGISCDLNFRKKLWNWKAGVSAESLARETMPRLMPFVDLVIANEEDADLALGIRAPATNVEAGTLNVARPDASVRA